MLAAQIRQVAAALLDLAIRIAPFDSREWGQAMRSELNHVEEHCAANWALGSTSVLARQAVASILIPGRRNHPLVPDAWLFREKISSRKAVMFTSGACVLAALMFFAAPPFRQAFQVAVKPWIAAIQRSSGNFEPDYQSLVRMAESRHDAEGLAFCSVRIQNPTEGARLADEAVRLDANLVWVYAVVAMRHPHLPEAGAWLNRLEKWDPTNALIHLITAESVAKSKPNLSPDDERAWQSEMQAAFESPKFDDYLVRVEQLHRTVIPRYGFYNAYEVQSREVLDLPVYALQNAVSLANQLLSGRAGPDRMGHRESEPEKYWAVARFGQLLDEQGHTDFEHSAGTTLQSMAYSRLRASSTKNGAPEEAALFSYLAAKFDPANVKRTSPSTGSAFGPETARRNATVVEIAGLMIMVFAALALVGTCIHSSNGRWGEPGQAERAKAAASLVVLTSAIGWLFSSATLYLTYRPYWYIFQSAIQFGTANRARDFHDFLDAMRVLPNAPSRFDIWLDSLHYYHSLHYLLFFWAGLAMVSFGCLALIGFRHIRNWGRIHALWHSP